MQEPPMRDGIGGPLLSASYCFLRLRWWSACALPAPAFVSTVRATVSLFFLARVELGALLGSEDVANLCRLLSADRLAALHYLTDLFHVAANCGGVALLPRRTGRIHEWLGLRA